LIAKGVRGISPCKPDSAGIGACVGTQAVLAVLIKNYFSGGEGRKE